MSHSADWFESYKLATQELLAERALLRRVDTKYVLGQRHLAALFRQLADDYAVLPSGSELVADYRTLYFDTEGLDAFMQHCRGSRPRHKVRIRHYPDRQKSYLEVKHKTAAERTVKWRRARVFQQNELSDNDRDFVASRHPAGRAPLRSILWTNFRRVTLLGLRSEERVTIDLDIRFQRGDQQRSLEDAVIVEVKQDRFRARSPIMLALRGRGIRPMAISKYCAAACLLFPDDRVKRYLPRLQALRKAQCA